VHACISCADASPDALELQQVRELLSIKAKKHPGKKKEYVAPVTAPAPAPVV
jgi:hypothetical protein